MNPSKNNRIKKLIFLITILFTNLIICQNFSNLQDKKLNKLNDTALDLLNIGAKKIDGKIDEVTVIYDSERTLKLNVKYTGLVKEFIEFEILNSDRKGIRDISKIKFSLEGKKSPLELEFTIHKNTPEGTEYVSPYLQISIRKEKSNFFPTTTLYSLNKNWKTEINPENLIIPVKLEPIGAARKLNSTPQLYYPSNKILFPKLKLSSPVYTIANSKLKAAFRAPKGKVYFFSDNKYYRYNIDVDKQEKVAIIKSNWKDLPDHFDAAFVWPKNKKAYFFKGNKYNRWSFNKGIDNKEFAISRFWKGVPSNLDAAVAHPNGKIYFFKGSKYYRYFNGKVEGIEQINRYWKGVPNNLDAALLHKNGKIYFFKEKKYFRYNIKEKRVDLTGNIGVDGWKGLSLLQAKTKEKKPKLPKPAIKKPSIELQGPDNNPIPLFDEISVEKDIDVKSSHAITNIDLEHVYPDKNKNSGVFYYLPQGYYIKWNTEDGYQFKTLYGTIDDSENTGSVRMTTTLTPNISKNERDLLTALVNSYAKKSKVKFEEIRSIPLKSTPKISLVSNLGGQYNISTSDITITESSSINNEVVASWKTDNITKEMMQNALSEEVGILGNMKLEPDNSDIEEITIPIKIAIKDKGTLGKMILKSDWRNKHWVNKTPFPLKIKYIHALLIDKTKPIIYSWGLENVSVPQKSKVHFDASKMPSWLDTDKRVKQLWVEYSIGECETCVNKILDELTGGTSGTNVKEITFETFQIFEKTNANKLNVSIRSIQADPKGNKIVEISKDIKEDNSSIQIGPLYITDGAELEYEYYFKLITQEGDVYESKNWISSGQLEIYIGMKLLEKEISELPKF